MSLALFMFLTVYIMIPIAFIIYMMDSFFVVRAKINIKSTLFKWKRHCPKNILSDYQIELIGFYT